MVPTTVEDWVRAAKNGLKTIVLAMLLGGWTIGWGLVLLIGWATGSALALGMSFGALALGSFAGFGWRYAIVRQRRLLAKESLRARLRLRRVAVAGDLLPLVDLFDLVFRDVNEALARPELGRALADSVRATFDEASRQLEELAGTWAATDEDIRKLSAMPNLETVEARLAMAKDKRKTLERSAQKIVEDAHRVSKQMTEVQGLIGAGPDDRDKTPLEEALTTLESTARAYRELA
jgi:hypothetical protein